MILRQPPEFVYHSSFRAVRKPIRCKGCHNPEAWDFEGGKEFTSQTLEDLYNGLIANGIKRTLCIMGGEPMCGENLFLTDLVIIEMKKKIPDLKVWVWTGYERDKIFARTDPRTKNILETINGIVTGPYIESLRDITLPMRGSSNQEIINLKN